MTADTPGHSRTGRSGDYRGRHSRRSMWDRFVGFFYYRHPWTIVVTGVALFLTAVGLVVNDVIHR